MANGKIDKCGRIDKKQCLWQNVSVSRTTCDSTYGYGWGILN